MEKKIVYNAFDVSIPALSSQDIISVEELLERKNELEETVNDELEDEYKEIKRILSTIKGRNHLINESHMRNYLIELVHNIGLVPKYLPYLIKENINWDGVVSELMKDYLPIVINGVTFYYGVLYEDMNSV